MKFVVLCAGLLSVVPLSLWLQSGGESARRFWMLFGLLPFLVPSVYGLDMSIISWWPEWKGLLAGVELTAIDIFALAAYFSLKPVHNRFWYKVPPLIYLLAICISSLHADQPFASFFYIWQFCRIFFLIVVITRACRDAEIPEMLLNGMAAGVCLEAFMVVFQRYGQGLIQTPGTFAHQNTLGLVIHLVVLPHFALLLASVKGWRFAIVPVMGALVSVMTASRAALGFAVLGLGLVYLMSLTRGITLRKALVAVAGLMMVAVIAPLAVESLSKRFEVTPLTETEYDERAAFNRSAEMILQDHPFGVGANHYVYMSYNFGYAERAGVARQEENLSNIVHNIYWFTAAENGYPGLFALLFLLLHPMVTALRIGWRDKGTPRGDLLLGLGLAMAVVYGHSTLEYIFLSKEAQYLFAIVVGMTYGVANQVPVRARRMVRRGAVTPVGTRPQEQAALT